MMSFGKFIALASLALCGCASNGGMLEPMALAEHEVAAVKASVTSELKDPDSARFGQVVAGKDMLGGSWACGWVNAKNSFGGYTGKEPFVAKIDDGPDGRRYKPVTIGGHAGMSCMGLLSAS